MSYPYQLRSMDNHTERTEGLSVADAARSHVPPELAGRDSDVEASSSFSDEGAAVVASGAIPSHSTQPQPLQQSITTAPVSPLAASRGVAGASSPSLVCPFVCLSVCSSRF